NRLPGILRWKLDNVNTLADWVLSRPELVSHVLVDDDGNWLGQFVLIVKESAAPQGDTHRFKIVAADNPLIRVKKFLAGKWDPSFHCDRCPCEGFAQWQ